MHVMLTRSVTAAQRSAAAGALLACAPLLAQAQSSPFMTGATALQTNILAWLTPIAVILVMVLGAMAMANRIVAERNVVAVGNYGVFALGHGERHEVVRLAAERGSDRHGHRGGHALEIVVGNGNLARAGIADAIRRL